MKSVLPFFLLLVSQFSSQSQTADLPAKPIQTSEIYFDFGKHDLRPEAEATLSELATFCEGKKNITLKITAHTDSIGTFSNNEALSNRRAQAVIAFLTAKGLPENTFKVSTFGEKKPVADNDSDDGRQRNRRATIEVLQAIPAVSEDKKMVTIEGTVTDLRTGQPIVADVILRSKDFRDSLRTDATGYFKKTVPPGTVVGIDAFAHCYFMKTDMVKAVPGIKPVILPLQPALSGSKIDIENLYFVGDQAVLLEKSKPELPKILRFMELNPEMKIEIAGHVNYPNRPSLGKDTWEYRLSVARAKTVADYLLENGIAADRISHKGYGNWEMVFPRAVAEAEQAKNRRVEIRILEGGCEN